MAEKEILIACEDYLAQGDIFYYPIVAPYGDHDIRILRSSDAKHGSHVMETGVACRIFSIEDLERVLTDFPIDELRTHPFDPATDSQEMVVVFGALRNYFIIVSQTCDISGKDKIPLAVAAIVPFIAIKDFCTTTNIPFKTDSESHLDTIAGQIKKQTSVDLMGKEFNEMNFPSELRDVINNWNAKGNQQQQIKSQIKTFLNKLTQNQSSYIYYLDKNEQYYIPEGFADFTHLITVPTEQLANLKDHRLATLNNPYREEFSNKIGDFFARVATPRPSKGKKF